MCNEPHFALGRRTGRLAHEEVGDGRHDLPPAVQLRGAHGGPGDGRGLEHANLRGRGDLAETRIDPVEERVIVRAEDAAAEHHVDVEPLHAQPSDGGSRHRHDLVGLALDHLTRDGVALARHLEQDGRHLRQSLLVDAPEVDGLHELPRPLQTEMPRHGALQRRLPAAAVFRTHGVP